MYYLRRDSSYFRHVFEKTRRSLKTHFEERTTSFYLLCTISVFGNGVPLFVLCARDKSRDEFPWISSTEQYANQAANPQGLCASQAANPEGYVAHTTVMCYSSRVPAMVMWYWNRIHATVRNGYVLLKPLTRNSYVLLKARTRNSALNIL